MVPLFAFYELWLLSPNIHIDLDYDLSWKSTIHQEFGGVYGVWRHCISSLYLTDDLDKSIATTIAFFGQCQDAEQDT